MMLKASLLVVLVACALGGTLPAKKVGIRNTPRPVGTGTRIIGGSDAAPGQFPWQITIQLESGAVHLHICGGSILSETWAVTAGHCLVGEPIVGHLLVIAGEHDFETEEGNEQHVLVDEYFIHPDYPNLPVVAPNDIALMKLSTPLVFNEWVAPIPLPAEGTIHTGMSVLSGWGQIGGSLIFPDMPSILQTAELPLISIDECMALYPEEPLELSNICTGPLEGGISACQGDSGGPLVAQGEDGNMELVGIVSWGTWPCASPNAPSVFTRVSAFIDFIDETMNA